MKNTIPFTSVSPKRKYSGRTLNNIYMRKTKLILKFMWRKDKRPLIANTVLREKNKTEGLSPPSFSAL